MPLDTQTKTKIEELIRSNDVVLFMKGSRHFPQCGFSATVVQILDKLVSKYATVNVLSDPAIRDGVKEFSQWPTIPQLYIKGDFVGGCDIVKELYASGDLQKKIGGAVAAAASAVASGPPPKTPSITVSDAAAKAFLGAADEAGDDVLRLEIDPKFQNDLYFGPRRAGDLEVNVGKLSLFVDRETAGRADGVTIDFVEAAGAAGFKVTNPQEPPRVRPIAPVDVRAMKGKVTLFDVRPKDERALASIDWARGLDDGGQDELAALPKSAPIAFLCHHGTRSRRAAEEALRDGYTNVYNVEGGIDAWAKTADPSVARY